MTPEEEALLAALEAKKRSERGQATVLHVVRTSTKNFMADKLSEFAAMAQRGELFDYAITVVKKDGMTVDCAWGEPVPTLQICGAVSALQFHMLNALKST